VEPPGCGPRVSAGGSPLLVIDWTRRRREALAMEKRASVFQPIRKVDTLPLAGRDADEKTGLWEDIARIRWFAFICQPAGVSNHMAKCIAPYRDRWRHERVHGFCELVARQGLRCVGLALGPVICVQVC